MTVYVMDSGPLIDLFRHYYRDRFPSLWKQFDDLCNDGSLTSTREVRNELIGYGDELSDWCRKNARLFPTPTDAELEHVSAIFAVEHFQAMIRTKQRLAGKPVADPFVIARAKVIGGCVVTAEHSAPNSPRVPNVCDHFGVDHTNLEGFMAREGWTF